MIKIPIEQIVLYIAVAIAALMSVISVITTIADKLASKARGCRRVPEAALLMLGACGGALAMLATMVIIHHKTRHAKFMILLPLFSLLHIVALVALLIWQ